MLRPDWMREPSKSPGAGRSRSFSDVHYSSQPAPEAHGKKDQVSKEMKTKSGIEEGEELKPLLLLLASVCTPHPGA